MVLLTRKKRCEEPNISKIKLLTSFTIGALSLATAIFIILTDPILIIVQTHLHLTNGSDIHKFLEKEREPSVLNSVYLFNITNAERFQSGEDDKLKLEEVGPFTYMELRTNEEMVIDEEAGELRYHPRIDVVFQEELSGPPEDIVVTMPNLPMLGMNSMLTSYSYLTRAGFRMLSNQLSSKAVVTKDARSYLWGYSEPLVTLANTVVPGFIHFNKIGIMDRLYDKNNVNRLVVGATGKDKFIIKSRNGHRKLRMSEFENPDKCTKCNNFNNSYEGYMYISPVTPQTPIRIFKNGFCRILDMVFHEQRILDSDVEALVFNLRDSFFSLDGNPDNDGILDVSSCFFGLPLALTKAHFLGHNASVYERIEGLKPDPEKHNNFVVIEPMIGMEMDTHFAIQINLMVGDLTHIPEAKRFSNMLLPIGYTLITQPPLPDKTKADLHMMYVILPAVLLAMRIILPLLAVLLLSYTACLTYWKCVYRIDEHVLCTTMSLEKKVVPSVEEPLKTRITNGSLVHEFLKKEFEGIHLSIYMFNITNAEEFIAGEDHMLRVEEVGPFTYKEMRRHEDLEMDVEAGVLRYSPRINPTFQPTESIGNPEDLHVTMPNLPMLGLASKISTFPFMARLGFNMLTKQLNSKPVVTMDAHTYLWGYHEPLVSLAHTIVPGMVNFEKMGVLDRMYDEKNLNKLELSIQDNDKYMIKKRNGHSKLRRSDGVNPDECEKCSTFDNAYEGVGYPAGITPDFPLRIFRNGLCKILDMEYYNTTTTDYGIDGLVYHFSDNFYENNPNNDSNGVLDVSDCFYGLPLGFTKPHFLDLDPKLYERVEGMEPGEKHRGWVTIEPKLGMQLETIFSLQMNYVLEDLGYNSDARCFSNMVLPICYVKIEQPSLPEETIRTMRLLLLYVHYGVQAFKLLLFVITIYSWAYFTKLIYRNLIIKGTTFPNMYETKPCLIVE